MNIYFFSSNALHIKKPNENKNNKFIFKIPSLKIFKRKKYKTPFNIPNKKITKKNFLL